MKIFQGIVLSVAFLAAINSPAQHTAKKDVSYDLYLTQIAAAEAFYQLNLISTANQYLEVADEKFRNM